MFRAFKSLLGDDFPDPLEVGRVALLDGQADDLGHLVGVVGAGEEAHRAGTVRHEAMVT